MTQVVSTLPMGGLSSGAPSAARPLARTSQAKTRGTVPVSVCDTNRRLAEAVVSCLADLGIRSAFISPGSRSTPLVLAFDAHPELTTRVFLDERSAAFAALGVARSTGAPAALLCTSGSAGGHYLAAAIEGRSGRVPMVILTADRPPELQYCGSPQTVEQQRLLGRHAAYIEIGAPGPALAERWVRLRLAQGLAAATGLAPGPVHFNVAFRTPLWSDALDASHEHAEVPRPKLVPPVVVATPRIEVGRSRLRDDTARDLAREMGTEVEGVIVVGQLPVHTAQQNAEALTRLAWALDWPILCEPTSNLRFGVHDRTRLIAHNDVILRGESARRLLRPRMCLQVGATSTSTPVREWLRDSLSHQVLVNPAGDWNDPDIGADTLFCVNPVDFCDQILAALREQTQTGCRTETDGYRWMSIWRGAERIATRALTPFGHQWWEGAIARSVVENVPDGCLLLVGSGMPIRDLDAFTPARHERVGVIANRGANGIDGLVATALGASLGWTEGPVVGLIGDLTFLHDLDGIRAATAAAAQLTIVVVNNNGGGIFGQLPIAAHGTAFERYFLTPHDLCLADVCQGLGARHRRVTCNADLAEALRTTVPRRGVDIIEALIDRHDSDARRSRARDAVQTELASWLESQHSAPSPGIPYTPDTETQS